MYVIAKNNPPTSLSYSHTSSKTAFSVNGRFLFVCVFVFILVGLLCLENFECVGIRKVNAKAFNFYLAMCHRLTQQTCCCGHRISTGICAFTGMWCDLGTSH